MNRFLIPLLCILFFQNCSFNGNTNRLNKDGIVLSGSKTTLIEIQQIFQKNPNIDSFTMNGEVHWFRFTIDNFEEGENALVVPDYQINLLKLFIEKDDVLGEEILTTGDEIPVSAYSNKSRSNVALINLEKGHKYRIFAQYFRPGNRPQLVINLMSVPEFAKHSKQLEWSYGIIYGLLIVYLLLVLTVFLWTRDEKYFFFLLWVMSYLVYFSTTSGHLKFYVFPEMGQKFSLIRLEFMLISMYSMTEFSLIYYGYRKKFRWVIWIWFALLLWSLFTIFYTPAAGKSVFDGNEKLYIFIIRGIFLGFVTLQTYLSISWVIKNKTISFLSIMFLFYLLNMFLYLYQTVYLDNVDFDFFILATVWFLILEILSIAGGLSYYLMKDNQRNLSLIQQNTVLKKELNRVHFNIQEQEKRRIAREIHDDILNRLSMLLLLSRDGYLSHASLVNRLRTLSKDVKLYTLGLYPIWVKKMKLSEIIDQNIQELCNALNIKLNSQVDTQMPELNTTFKLQLFRIIFEFVSNTGKHANAENIHLSIIYYKNTQEIILNLYDDGAGLNVNQNRGLGLTSIQNRVSMLNGQMSVQNKEGFGVEWTIIIPLQNSHLSEFQD